MHGNFIGVLIGLTGRLKNLNPTGRPTRPVSISGPHTYVDRKIDRFSSHALTCYRISLEENDSYFENQLGWF